MYVLIVMWLVSAGGGQGSYAQNWATSMQEFSSKATCEKARSIFARHEETKAFCVPK